MNHREGCNETISRCVYMLVVGIWPKLKFKKSITKELTYDFNRQKANDQNK